MNSKIKILIAEHEASDIELLYNELKNGGINFISEVVKTETAFTDSITKFQPDLIFSDYSFPNFSGVAAFYIREDLAPHTPFIIVSGTIGEENSVELIKIGVSDYVLKDKLFTLVPKVNRALRDLFAWKKKEEVQKQLVLSEAQLAEAQAIAKTGSWVTDLSDQSVKWSRETFRIYGMEDHTGSITHEEFLVLVHPEDRVYVDTAFKNSLDTFSVSTFEHRIITSSGELKYVEENWKIIRDEQGIPVRAMGSCQEITERKQLEELREFERANLANAQKLAQMGSWDYNIQTDKINWSDALYYVFDVDQKTLGTAHDSFFKLIDEEDRKRVKKIVRHTEETGEPFTIEYSITTPSGEKRIIQEHGYGKKDETGKVIHLFGTAQDISEAKKYEAAILKAYEEKDTVLESIDDGFFTLDKNSHVTYWNRKAESLLSTKKEDIIGKNIHEYFSSAGSIGFHQQYEKAAKENITLHFEEFSKRTNKWFAVSAFGSENGLSVYFKDVTEKKKLESQQEFDRNNLDALINNTNGMMWSVDRNFNLITSNELFDQVTMSMSGGIKIEKGTNILSPMFPADMMASFKLNYERAFAGETFTEEVHNQTPIEFWTETSYYPIRKGKEVIGTACHSSNITEKKKAEVAILTALEEKNTILESIGDGFFTLDKSWTVTYWNCQAEKMLNTPKEIILGKSFWEIFPECVGTISYINYHQAMENNKAIVFEHFYVPLKRWFDISASPSLNGLTVYFKDITKKKESEIQLNKLHADLLRHVKELALSNAELEQFAYVASHDLQEPLRMITSFLSQLDKKYSPVIDEKGKKYIHFAVDGAKRMRQIILDLLEFSRVGRIEDKLETIDINLLVEEIQNLFHNQISEKETIICVDKMPVINSYNAPIRQVFQNLVGNALKYTREDHPCHINITAVESSDSWQFAIEDNGIGISAEYYDKIFIIFQRLHNKDEYSGTGMGLAVTKKIIENLGGRIRVESEVGKGSIFYFTIPKKLI